MLYVQSIKGDNLFICDTDDNSVDEITIKEYRRLTGSGIEIFYFSIKDNWDDNGATYFTVSLNYKDYCVDVKYSGGTSNLGYVMETDRGRELYESVTGLGIRKLDTAETSVILNFVTDYRRKK